MPDCFIDVPATLEALDNSPIVWFFLKGSAPIWLVGLVVWTLIWEYPLKMLHRWAKRRS